MTPAVANVTAGHPASKTGHLRRINQFAIQRHFQPVVRTRRIQQRVVRAKSRQIFETIVLEAASTIPQVVHRRNRYGMDEDECMRVTRIVIVLMLAVAASASAKDRYYGAIDVGSKGTKATLYSFVNDGDGVDQTILYKKSINTKLASSMKDNRFTAEASGDGADAVKQLIDEMQAKAAQEKIGDVQFYVVGSSAVASGANRNDLVAAVKAVTGKDMDFVDARDEGYFGLLSAVPQKRRTTAILVDIGSGNTKVGCLVGESISKNYKSAEIPYGSV